MSKHKTIVIDPSSEQQYSLVFCFVFMPLIQKELDLYVYRYNTSPRRANRKSVLPTDAPLQVYEQPSNYGAEDYKAGASSFLEDVIANLLCSRLLFPLMLLLKLGSSMRIQVILFLPFCLQDLTHMFNTSTQSLVEWKLIVTMPGLFTSPY